MKILQHTALAAVLALLSCPADAASRHRKGAAQPDTPAARTLAPETGSYYVPYVTDAAGNQVPIMQVPGSVTVVPRKVIDDQQDITLCGALRNVSGVVCR